MGTVRSADGAVRWLSLWLAIEDLAVCCRLQPPAVTFRL